MNEKELRELREALVKLDQEALAQFIEALGDEKYLEKFVDLLASDPNRQLEWADAQRGPRPGWIQAAEIHAGIELVRALDRVSEVQRKALMAGARIQRDERDRNLIAELIAKLYPSHA